MIDKLLFPKHCPVCDNIVTGDELICPGCRGVFRYVPEPRCLKCGKHIDFAEEEFCFDCKRNAKKFTSGVALYEYESVGDAIFAFKNGGRKEYGRYFGREIAGKLGKTIKAYKPDYLVPIPLSKQRYKKRGFNQAKVLAEVISEATGIPINTEILMRNSRTKEQKKLSVGERQNNMVGAFQIAQNVVKLTIVLVDDVYTTGSTVNEAAVALLNKGADKVFFVTLAIGEGV